MAKSKKSKTAKPSPPKATPVVPIDECVKSSVIQATLNIANQPVLMKVCRLCGAKEGPFLNIFDPEQVTATKIDQLMPFKVAENDDLPHKICFRCSAKVEELHEFVQKCINTQENLHSTMGKNAPIIVKNKTRSVWEDKLNKSNMSNDDICDALIKRAMEGIKGIPLKTVPSEEGTGISKKELPTKNQIKPPSPDPAQMENLSNQTDSQNDTSLKRVKLKLDKCDTRTTRKSRLNNPDRLLTNDRNNEIVNTNKQNDTNNRVKNDPPAPAVTSRVKQFNIMDHVSMIKVNGVGVLFQCKLCNRNFLKKDVVLSHGCAKSGVPKVDLTPNFLPPEPPKVPTVKYINTKVTKDLKNTADNEVSKPPVTETKVKPKIGPASKTRRNRNESNSSTEVTTETDTSIKVNQSQLPAQSAAPVPNQVVPTVNFPSIPSLHGRYKLMPGPNNTFTLVEDTNLVASNDSDPCPPKSHSKKRKSDDGKKSLLLNNVHSDKTDNSKAVVPNNSSDIIDLDGQPDQKLASVEQPYPVGLFQTVAHSMVAPTDLNQPKQPEFTTPAMKKQSYTVVQTGNPNKLLISTKPHIAEEVPKKRSKKVKVNRTEEEPKEPFSVTLEDANHPKDPGFFTFINVDPLLQPSYVLPTDNIIQESQISTSTSVAPERSETKEKEKYSCNMCSETFSREKKLLTHIHSHYNKMDEEDLLRTEKTASRKRSKRR
ncbi:LOW QUALITY PROTEIN: uncharacterized protein ACR2FA_005134 [Aphomia sociella]